jgi:hypothetical protein
MPPTTTKEHQRERDRRRAQAYRDRHPERARESRRKCDAKRRQAAGWSPKCARLDKPKRKLPTCKKPEQLKKEVRAAMIRARMEYLAKAKTLTPADLANG